jgi:hypothetical protein
MAEREAIVRIHGAIDRAVQADPKAREQVAQLLPRYRDPKLQWYDEFRKWLTDTGGKDAAGEIDPDPVAAVKEALQELAAPAEHPRSQARRMFAVALTARAFPDDAIQEDAVNAITTFPPVVAEEIAVAEDETQPDDDAPADGEEVVEAEVVEAEVVDPEEAKKRAEGLYELLANQEHPTLMRAVMRPDLMRPDDEELAPRTDWWKTLIEEAEGNGSIPKYSIGLFPRPCAGRLLTVPGVDGPVAALRTEHVTEPGREGADKLTFDIATNFIEPCNWATCMPSFWCQVERMEDPQLPPGQHRYREVVSTHCGDYGPGFWASTDLLFNFMWVPEEGDEARAAIANYELAAGRPLPQDRIIVDEGTLVVSKIDDDALLITTTKRVKFSHPFPTGALALIVCALGYADISGNLLACSATHGKRISKGLATADTVPFELPLDLGCGKKVGHPFPGIPAKLATRRSGGPAGFGEGRAGGIMQDTMDIYARAMRDTAKAVEQNRPGG